MELNSFRNATAFRDRVAPFLLIKEAENCLGLGIIDTLQNNPNAYPNAHLWAVTDAGEVIGAAWMTPPHPIGLTEMPNQAIQLLIEEISHLSELPNAVVGPKPQADRFRDHWLRKHGLRVSSTISQRIYQATKIESPFDVPGEMRIAEKSDLELIAEWHRRFLIDCGLMTEIPRAKECAERDINDRKRYLWILNGSAVAMAGVTGSTPSGIRISWVYTPDHSRGKGYASALVTALSRKMLSEGKTFCFLYTDLANKTSNSIYQKIGYRPICDSAHHTFAP